MARIGAHEPLSSPVEGEVSAKPTEGVMRQRLRADRSMIDRARGLRRRMTEEETVLWVELRALRAQGLHFRRQVPHRDFIADFACLRARLVIEVDGDHHAVGEQRAFDLRRDDCFNEDGFEVIRVPNIDVRKHLDDVVTHLFHVATRRIAAGHPTRSGFAGPPSPRRGGKGERQGRHMARAIAASGGNETRNEVSAAPSCSFEAEVPTKRVEGMTRLLPSSTNTP